MSLKAPNTASQKRFLLSREALSRLIRDREGRLFTSKKKTITASQEDAEIEPLRRQTIS